MTLPETDLVCKQFAPLPNVVGDARLHSGDYAERTMNPAKVVVEKVQGQSCDQVLPLFGESVGKSSSEALHVQIPALTGRMFAAGVRLPGSRTKKKDEAQACQVSSST